MSNLLCALAAAAAANSCATAVVGTSAASVPSYTGHVGGVSCLTSLPPASSAASQLPFIACRREPRWSLLLRRWLSMGSGRGALPRLLLLSLHLGLAAAAGLVFPVPGGKVLGVNLGNWLLYEVRRRGSRMSLIAPAMDGPGGATSLLVRRR